MHKIFRDKEAVMRAIHDVQAKHSPTRMLIKAAAIPKEFEEYKEPTKVIFYVFLD